MALILDRDRLNALMDRIFPQIADLVRVEAVDEQQLVARHRVDERHLRPGGTVSGPTMFALADVALYLAILSSASERAAIIAVESAL